MTSLLFINGTQQSSRNKKKKNITPISYFGYNSEKMLTILESIQNNEESSNDYLSQDNIYGLLLKTELYLNVIDMCYKNLKIYFRIR